MLNRLSFKKNTDNTNAARRTNYATRNSVAHKTRKRKDPLNIQQQRQNLQSQIIQMQYSITYLQRELDKLSSPTPHIEFSKKTFNGITRPTKRLSTSTPSFRSNFFRTVLPSVSIYPKNNPLKVYQLTDTSGNKLNECYILLRELRKDDVFPESFSKEKMIELFFPKDAQDLALSLSNVTSAFYGILLESTGKIVGFEHVNKISKDFFYNLGSFKAKKTKESIDGKFKIPNDARGVAIILVSAIYNASPEYKIEIKQFNEDFCQISLRGVDRYYRMTKVLEIEKHLEWPVLHTFMEGILNGLSIEGFKIESDMLNVEPSGTCHEEFRIKKR